MNKITKTEQRRRAKVYRDAARIVNDARSNEYSCHAVAKAAGANVLRFDTVREVQRYEKHFKPDDCYSNAWGMDWSAASLNATRDYSRVGEERTRDCRVLALLFASAMAATGDL